MTARVVIEVVNGEVRVNGPLDNNLAMYGLLKLAEKVLDRHYESERQKAKGLPQLLVARGNLPVNGRD